MQSPEILAANVAAAIEHADKDGCVALFNGLTETERRALAPAIVSRYTQLDAILLDYESPYEQRHMFWTQFEAASLALYATATLGEIKKLRAQAIFDPRLYDVLAARRPDWLESWIAWTLEDSGASWKAIRRLIRNGIAKRPDADANYCLWMIPHQHASVRETLDADPELLEHELWRLFEIEGRADVSLAQNDKYFRKWASGASCWEDTLVSLACEGRIDRQRLLAASLGALQRGLPQFQAGWFSRFHEALTPTVEERAHFAADYLVLLSSPIPPTVSFALNALALVHKSDQLDAAAFLEAVRPALHAREKSTAEAVLKLLNSIGRQRSGLRDAAAELTVTLLEHPAVDVQEKALNLIERFSDAERLPERLAIAATLVAPSLRKRLRADEPPRDPAPAAPDPRLKSIPEKWLRMAGVTETGSLTPLDLLQPGIPRLHEGNRIRPIETVEELVPLYLHVLEAEGPPDDLERVLDGVARLCNQRPQGFDRLVSPLLKRAKQKIQKSTWRTPANLLSALGLAWLAETPWMIGHDGENPGTFLTQRVQALAERALKGSAQPLFSSPTHSGGWIDAGEAEARSPLRETTDEFDLTLGKLRAGEIPTPVWLAKKLDDEHLIRWTATFTPTRRADWFEAGASAIAANLDWWEARWWNRAFFDPLFEPDTPLGEAGLRLLALGLAAKESGEGTLATDALIAAISDGRVEPSDLGGALVKVLAQPHIVIPRIAKRLTQASQASTLHAMTILTALDQVLSIAKDKPLRQLFSDLNAQCAGGDLGAEQLRTRLDRAERWRLVAS